MTPISTIAINTYRESVRSKVLYSVLFFALGVILVSAFFGAVTIGDQVKVIKDFGLFSISIFTVLYASISGAALLFKELSRKTVYNILAKPVDRSQFLIGKFLGMALTASTLVSIMGLLLSLFLYLLEQRVDWLMFNAYLQILFELCIVCACAIFFSSIVVTPILSGAFTFGAFLVGRSSEQLLYFVNQQQMSKALSSAVEIIYVVIPPLDKIEVSNQIVYGIPVTADHTLWSIAVVVGYCGALLALATIFFSRKEFN